MKWALFIGAVLVAYGLGRWLRRSPRWQLHLWVLAGLLPFIPQPGMGIIFDREFPGDSHGIEVALLDILAITLLAATGGVAHRKVPYRALLVAYLLAALLSVTQAVEPGRVLGQELAGGRSPPSSTSGSSCECSSSSWSWCGPPS